MPATMTEKEAKHLKQLSEASEGSKSPPKIFESGGTLVKGEGSATPTLDLISRIEHEMKEYSFTVKRDHERVRVIRTEYIQTIINSFIRGGSQ